MVSLITLISSKQETYLPNVADRNKERQIHKLVNCTNVHVHIYMCMCFLTLII